MSIIIGCDSFLALRNVRNGDLGWHLHGDRVIAWVDPHQFEGSMQARPRSVDVDRLEDFDARRNDDLGSLLRRANLARKCYYDPATKWVKLKRSSYRNNRHNSWRRAASVGRAAVTLAGYWAAGRVGGAQRWRQQFSKALRRQSVVNIYRRRLQDVDASVVLGLSPEGGREMALIEAANSMAIPTAVMIRSRDNLASKIPFLPYAEVYLVWSHVTRQFLLGMYPEISEKHVRVIGSPQFDHHLDATYRLDRESFFSLVRLDPDRPIIVYTMATPGLIEHEIEVAQHLADAAHRGAFVRAAQLLVRGHPRMFGSNVQLLKKEYPEARSYPLPTEKPLKSPEHEANIVRLIIEDENVHLATLAYQDVQVNVCGTMTIDSAILDKPTVHVYYDLIEDVPPGLSVRRNYERSDIKQMLTYGASRLARDPNECIRLINDYLDDPTLDSAGRRRAREWDCGPLDGGAGRRIAGVLTALAHEHGARPQELRA